MAAGRTVRHPSEQDRSIDLTGKNNCMSPACAVHVAIPCMDEYEWLPRTMDALLADADPQVRIWICVNQPDTWWSDDEKRQICENNQRSLAYLQSLPGDNIQLLDRSSPGRGWTGRKHGVGQARKTLMDKIDAHAGPNDLIVSLDADTLFDQGYLASVRSCFNRHPNAVALSNPYFHRLTGDGLIDRAMLRYEIYMRYYTTNMWRIGSPYSFTALGSAFSLPVRIYRKTGGITAKKSGEDFYFLQKLRKTGWICNHNTHKVYPAARFSDRVFFGTGPALIKGSKGDWSSYPIYPHGLFDQVKRSYELFGSLYKEEFDTPMTRFLRQQFRDRDPFMALRKNSTSREGFVTACHQKVDGLRVLQFLKSKHKEVDTSDEEHLVQFLYSLYDEPPLNGKPQGFSLPALSSSVREQLSALSFSDSPVRFLDQIRYLLSDIETAYQKGDLP